MQLQIENIRGFAGKHELDIKPLTILVGENSSGKTTLLSSLFAALQSDFPSADAFNRNPFELGSFETIATYRGGKYGRAPNFSIAWKSDADTQYFLEARFASYLGAPRVVEICASRGVMSLSGDFATGNWIIRQEGQPDISFRGPSESKPTFPLSDVIRFFMAEMRKNTDKASRSRLESTLNLLYSFSYSSSREKPIAKALAPLRSRPRRTYDELVEEFKPEGDHVPLVLARALSSEERRDKDLAAALESFGKDSGLFSSLKVKRMGRQSSDPFQLRVKSAGPDANLVDVGYGVSQALPVIVDSIDAKKGTVVLIQQPEVHLHPKAQAALGTFFARLAGDSSKRFVIETHSDYLIDRVRQAVANGIIKKESVNIAYLARDKLNVVIHQLVLDKNGNIENAPPSYRKFFLEEEMRLLFRGQ